MDISPNLVHDYGLNIKDRTIYLHSFDPFGSAQEEAGVDFRYMNRFVKNLDILNSINHDNITVKLASMGGEWSYGMAIYDAIRMSPSRVTMIGYATVRSMGTIIMQAAHERVLMPNTDFMIHYGTSSYSGHYIEVKSGIKQEELYEQLMLNIYAGRCQHGAKFKGKTMAEVREFLDRKMKDLSDWWLTSTEAIEYGFVDKIFSR